ncbi:MAG TPA: M24 family metallopeptidase [Solirubrobacterales bacterium]|nr:M24 family metallopeptidase [Solirubrobacterales bacterium]
MSVDAPVGGGVGTPPTAEPGLAYPRFSDAEMAARRTRLDSLLAEHGIDHALVYGANRVGSAVPWLTGWPVTREALVVHTPGERDLLLVNFYNHVPNAQRMAVDAEVAWAGENSIDTALAELSRRGSAGARIGAIGPFGHRAFAAVEEFARAAVDLNREYARLRLLKSAEEVEWTRKAAALTDDGVRALRRHAIPGATEHVLADAVERAYVPGGGATHIHYFGASAMARPSVCVPAQWPSTRPLAAGDALTCEISASWWGYTGQLLRTFSVAAEPTKLYAELHAAADAAFDAIVARLRPGATAGDLVEAAGVIEAAGFTIRDDLVHGFVGGYLPPVLGTASRSLTPVPDFTFAAGMMVVVQPNVVTRDETAGVQTGELLLVTGQGAESLHSFERGLLGTGYEESS